MEADTQAQVAFFLTGKRGAEHLDAVDGLGLRPALFAGYRDLSELRYDFPLVLAESGDVRPLSGILDSALEAVAGGSDGERIRKHVLRLEKEIRTLVAQGAAGRLSVLWDQAASRLGKATDPSFEDSLSRTRPAITIEGELVDCDAAMPSRLLRHAWKAVQNKKAEAFGKDLRRLILKLSDIQRSDFERSEAGRSAQHLEQSIGSAHGGMFDFEAMSKLLTRSLPKDAVPEARRQRIRDLLAVLNSQQFFPAPGGAGEQPGAAKSYSFVFEGCGAALEAFSQRLPKAIELAKAMAIAELEIDGQYHESKHDVLFQDFGANGLDPQDLATFPDYLVCVNAGGSPEAEHAKLMEILSSGLPIKVLLQTDDILEESPLGEGNLNSGTRCKQIANMAIGLNEVYVLQSSSSNLYQFRDRILKGLTYGGPALFSVYSGVSGKASGLPPYLTAAAAMESRAFPAFTYDPSAGPNWASRFYLEANSQVDLDWPVSAFAYENEEHQRVSEDLAFTLLDFVASDRRYTKHFARVPRHKWNGSMIPVDESLAQERKGLPDKIPCLMMVDGNNALQKVIVDQKLIREARRCRDMWHSLQELGGIHNSHAETLLARERRAWEERMAQEAEAHAAAAAIAAPAPTAAVAPPPSAPVAAAPAAAAPPAASPAPAVEQVPERSPDDAYIETPRCSTCNECTAINNKMFAYNADQQAYIADIKAGTYAQLVEAAENCQVSIIHPGKPKNPDEPGLEDLIKRAEAFL